MSLLSPETAGGAIALVVIYLFCIHVWYPARFSSLSKIPAAHFLAPWTPLWILRIRLTKGENKTIFQAHRDLGEIVRLGPNEVSVNSLEALKVIYVGGFDKHQWAANAGMVNDIPNAFSCVDGKTHGESRRLSTGVYSKSYIQNSEDAKAVWEEIISNRLVPHLKQTAARGRPTDMNVLASAIAYDLTAAYIFGIKGGTDTIQDLDERKQLFDAHDIIRPYFATFGELKTLLEKLEKVGIHAVPGRVIESFIGVIGHTASMCEKAKTEARAGNKAIVYSHVDQACDKVSMPWPKDGKVLAELFDQTVAGFETVAITLTYLVYEMSRHRDWQTRLREELKAAHTKHSKPGLLSTREVDSLPLLDAVVQETLRLYSAAAAPLARVTPKGGAQLGGYHIPGGVRISSNAYTLHRNEQVFPHCGTWDPNRWLAQSEQQLREMNRWFWAFGSGARMCLGIHLAMLELKYATAAIYAGFETDIAEAGNMTQLDGFIARPVGYKLDIRFGSL